jgi:hypothetical protein
MQEQLQYITSSAIADVKALITNATTAGIDNKSGM